MTDEITKIKIWNEDNDSEDDSTSSEISWQIEDGPTNPKQPVALGFGHCQFCRYCFFHNVKKLSFDCHCFFIGFHYIYIKKQKTGIAQFSAYKRRSIYRRKIL